MSSSYPSPPVSSPHIDILSMDDLTEEERAHRQAAQGGRSINSSSAPRSSQPTAAGGGGYSVHKHQRPGGREQGREDSEDQPANKRIFTESYVTNQSSQPPPFNFQQSSSGFVPGATAANPFYPSTNHQPVPDLANLWNNPQHSFSRSVHPVPAVETPTNESGHGGFFRGSGSSHSQARVRGHHAPMVYADGGGYDLESPPVLSNGKNISFIARFSNWLTLLPIRYGWPKLILYVIILATFIFLTINYVQTLQMNNKFNSFSTHTPESFERQVETPPLVQTTRPPVETPIVFDEKPPVVVPVSRVENVQSEVVDSTPVVVDSPMNGEIPPPAHSLAELPVSPPMVLPTPKNPYQPPDVLPGIAIVLTATPTTEATPSGPSVAPAKPSATKPSTSSPPAADAPKSKPSSTSESPDKSQSKEGKSKKDKAKANQSDNSEEVVEKKQVKDEPMKAEKKEKKEKPEKKVKKEQTETKPDAKSDAKSDTKSDTKEDTTADSGRLSAASRKKVYPSPYSPTELEFLRALSKSAATPGPVSDASWTPPASPDSDGFIFGDDIVLVIPTKADRHGHVAKALQSWGKLVKNKLVFSNKPDTEFGLNPIVVSNPHAKEWKAIDVRYHSWRVSQIMTYLYKQLHPTFDPSAVEEAVPNKFYLWIDDVTFPLFDQILTKLNTYRQAHGGAFPMFAGGPLVPRGFQKAYWKEQHSKAWNLFKDTKLPTTYAWLFGFNTDFLHYIGEHISLDSCPCLIGDDIAMGGMIACAGGSLAESGDTRWVYDFFTFPDKKSTQGFGDSPSTSVEVWRKNDAYHGIGTTELLEKTVQTYFKQAGIN